MDAPLPIASPDTICRPLPDGAVLFSARDEVYFGLNTVGARIWELLSASGATFDGLCAALHTDYPDVAIETIREDVRELLNHLLTAGLVMPRPTSSSPAPTADGAPIRANASIAGSR